MAARLGYDIDGCDASLLRPDAEEMRNEPPLPLTWTDAQYGLPPSAGCTYAAYCKPVMDGNVSRFLEMEDLSAGWWTPLLDRGSGGLLHIACDHGQLEMCVRARHASAGSGRRAAAGADGGVRLI